jgi:uncharacterized protein (DUF58 family)
MELNELIQKIQKVELLSKSVTHQKLSGLFNSSFKGRGLSFNSIRKYESGDDIRTINWNVTARIREPYTNTYTEDRERLIWIMIDVSGSGVFGTNKQSKADLAIEIGATLAFSALSNNDRVGVIFFSDRIEKLIQPARGMVNFWRIAKEMIHISPQGKSTDLTNALQYLLKINRQKSLIFLLSDFICKDYQAAAKVVAQQHELTPIRVFDNKEQSLPNVGWAKFKDAESGHEKWVNTGSKVFKDMYNSRYKEVEQYYNETFDRLSGGKLTIGTGDDYIQQLISFMSSHR